jgi:hypothetical protein
MSNLPQVAPANRHQWMLRLAFSLAVVLTLLFLAATWLTLGRANATIQSNALMDVYKDALSVIALLLAGTAIAIVWFAPLERANALAAAFACASALGFAWVLCDYSGAAESILMHRAGAVWLPAIRAAMAVVFQATPVLFLLFTEVFPSPLPADARAHAVLPELWRSRIAHGTPGNHYEWACPVLTLLWIVACITCAIGPVAGVAESVSYLVRAMLVICATLAMGYVTLRALRVIEGRLEPFALERWMAKAPDRFGSGLGALLLLGFVVLALAAILDLDLASNVTRNVALSTSLLFLLAFAVLLMCIRPIRAQSPAAFWTGWFLLAAAATPQILFIAGGSKYANGDHTLVAWAFWTVVCLLAGCANLLVSHLRSDAPAQARIKWILVGAVLALLAIAVVVLVMVYLIMTCIVPETPRCGAPSVVLGALPLAPPALMTLGMLLAIFASGALDSALALRRTAVFTALVVVLGSLFAMLEAKLDDLLHEIAPGTATPIAFTASLVVFHPTKHLCETGVKKLFGWLFGMDEPA